MRPAFRRCLFSVCLGIGFAFNSCDQDPAGLARRPLVGRYALEEFESGSYLLHIPTESSEAPEGRLKGQVQQIAWDSTTILVERKNDYVVVDVPSGLVRSPLSIEEARREPLFSRLAPAMFVWRGLPIS